MAEDFTQNLVDHCHIGFAAHVVPELGLYHAERGFDVGPLMVVHEKLIAPELVVVEHLGPPAPGLAAMDTLEGNIGDSAKARNRPIPRRLLLMYAFVPTGSKIGLPWIPAWSEALRCKGIVVRMPESSFH